jgi:subtilase family serine protease
MAPAGHAAAAPDLHAQIVATPSGTIITPGSSVKFGPARHAARTNIHIFVPAGATPGDAAPGGKFETPASLACVYGLTPYVAGCNPEKLNTVATTGSRMIAIVDAYHDATAAHDLAVYSAQFGLPKITAENFAVVYATGKRPAQDQTGDWEVEESLDIEMAHAMAPKAKVVLVEAASNSTADLLLAERVAGAMVSAAGGGEISNSWASSEAPQEIAFIPSFKADHVVFFASSGDSPGTSAPAVLPDVVGVGGTTINRTADGTFEGQTTWSIGGGGISGYLPVPAYQHNVESVVGKQRGSPDIAMIADPSSGVWVYDSTPYGGTVLNWLIIGGTSVASPAAAGLVNSAGRFYASSQTELGVMYSHLGDAADFTDITEGSCVNAASGNASVGYDVCTRIGAPKGLAGK